MNLAIDLAVGMSLAIDLAIGHVIQELSSATAIIEP
jgi:hypothetical protein